MRALYGMAAGLPKLVPIDYSSQMSKSFRMTCCSPTMRPDALRMLHEGLPEGQRTALVHALNATQDQIEHSFSGLLVAVDSLGLQGAVWVQLATGKTAVVWPPSNSSSAAEALMQEAAAFLDQHAISLAQILVCPDSPCESKLLATGGFQKLSDLAYLTLDRNFFPTSEPLCDLQFLPKASESPKRLGELLLRTYEGSLDCPKLNGVRNAEDVLDGYATQGTFAAERWFFACFNDQDVGALILTEHAESANWELVYMGVTPAARGKGFGWQIVQFALWQASRGNAERVVLAVDETNKHALSTYRKAGFIVWDRRTVFARLRS